MNWTCRVYGTHQDGGAHHYAYTSTAQVPYWTGGRWYQTQVWAWIDSGNPTCTSSRRG